jgi:hypothetical protein
MYAQRAVVLLSRWPDARPFRQLLSQLFAAALAAGDDSSGALTASFKSNDSSPIEGGVASCVVWAPKKNDPAAQPALHVHMLEQLLSFEQRFLPKPGSSLKLYLAPEPISSDTDVEAHQLEPALTAIPPVVLARNDARCLPDAVGAYAPLLQVRLAPLFGLQHV